MENINVITIIMDDVNGGEIELDIKLDDIDSLERLKSALPRIEACINKAILSKKLNTV